MEGNKTIFSAPATFSSNTGLDGICLTAKPVFKGDSATIKNCEFKDIELPASQTDHLASSIIGPSGWGSMKLDIENNIFYDNDKAYNAMELNVALANGSKISNNRFDLVCTHNIINIYDVEDGATIDISGNTFEKAANGIRIGVKGNKTCTININKNTYKSTDSGEYAGLVLIQPYGKATTGMGGITININGTVNKSGEEQLWYYYAGTKDAQLEIADRPKIYVDGVLQHYKDEPVEETESLDITPTDEEF